jgi:drug/metabolite transporter (DMT)-like permease
MKSIPKKCYSISPFIAILLAILAVSTASLLIRFAQKEVPSLVIAAYRLSLAAIITGVFTLPRYHKEIKTLNRNQFLLILLSGIFLAFHFAAWITSLELTTVTSSVVLVTTTPIWVSLFSPLILKEKISWKVGICLGIALLGSVVVTFSKSCTLTNGLPICNFSSSLKGEGGLMGNALALLGALMAAGYVMSGRNLRKTINLWPYTLLVYSVAAVVLLSLCVLFRYSLLGFSFQSYIWLMLLAIIPQILGHTSLNWALGFIPAAMVSITLLGEPVGSSIMAWIFLRESPTLIEMAGGMLILMGIILSSRLMNLAKQGISGRE